MNLGGLAAEPVLLAAVGNVPLRLMNKVGIEDRVVYSP